jgi:hypothetical protein
MKRFPLLFVLAAACGGSQNTGPVTGAHDASVRHYPVTVVEAHAALVDVLTKKYGAIASDDGLHVVARPACRDTDGDPCAYFKHDPVNAGGSSAAFTAGASSTETTGHYWFQVDGVVAGSDSDVQIELGGEAKDFKDKIFATGAPGSPAWMPHEVDEVRVAIDHALAPAPR